MCEFFQLEDTCNKADFYVISITASGYSFVKSEILIQILGNRPDLLTRKIIDSLNCHLSNAFESKTNDYSNLIAAFYHIFALKFMGK